MKHVSTKFTEYIGLATSQIYLLLSYYNISRS